MYPLLNTKGRNGMVNPVEQLPRTIRRIKLFTDNNSPIFRAVDYKVNREQSIIVSKGKRKAVIRVQLIYDPDDAEQEIQFKWTSINPEIVKAIIGNRKTWFVSKPIWSQRVFRCWISFSYLIDADENKRSLRGEDFSSE